MAKFALFAITSALFLAPSLAHAFTYIICLKHSVHSVDSNFGEDFEASVTGNSDWISRGSMVRVSKNGVWTTLNDTSTTTGCTSFVSPSGGPVIVELTADHQLANNQRVRIKNDFAGARPTKVWSFTAVLPNSNGSVGFVTPLSNESNLAAIAPWVVHRLTALAGNATGLNGKTIDVYNQNCSVVQGSCDGSAYSPGHQALFVAPEYSHSERKFLVGHEIGHWMEGWWGNGLAGGGGGYINDDPEDKCDFFGLGDHGMRSRELDFPAYKEGIAHFISALAWNDYGQGSGIFKYYKNDDPHDFETIELDVPGAFAFNWEGTECAPKLAGQSVEGDWLRHFWNFLNDSTGTDFQPTVLEIAAQVKQMYVTGGLNSGNAYLKLRTALTTANFGFWDGHWHNHGITHGVSDP